MCLQVTVKLAMEKARNEDWPSNSFSHTHTDIYAYSHTLPIRNKNLLKSDESPRIHSQCLPESVQKSSQKPSKFALKPFQNRPEMGTVRWGIPPGTEIILLAFRSMNRILNGFLSWKDSRVYYTVCTLKRQRSKMTHFPNPK